jgi:hypothetical protein
MAKATTAGLPHITFVVVGDNASLQRRRGERHPETNLPIVIEAGKFINPIANDLQGTLDEIEAAGYEFGPTCQITPSSAVWLLQRKA